LRELSSIKVAESSVLVKILRIFCLTATRWPRAQAGSFF
jgi:hypothetical protein